MLPHSPCYTAAQLQYTKKFLPALTKNWARLCLDPAKWLPCVLFHLVYLLLDVTNFAGVQFRRGYDQPRNIVEKKQT
jgi:hypothetical protein